MAITITEALAEIKTIDKRIQKKQEFVRQYLARPDNQKDPLEKNGGSAAEIAKEIQSITDLETRKVRLRRAAQKAADVTEVTVQGQTKTISEWLVWRREVAPQHKTFLNNLRQSLAMVRTQAQRSGGQVISAAAAVVDNSSGKASDIVVNIDEKQLANDIEAMETIEGELDGILSLKNATVQIEEIS